MAGLADLSVRDVPIIGPWVGRVSHLVDIVATPCEVSPTIAVKAMFNALPMLLISLYKPDTLDLVQERWGGPHKKRPKKRFRFNDLILGQPGPKNGQFGWVTFNLGQWAQRLGWYMLIVDSTIDFAVNWTTTAYQWSGCKTPGTAFARSGCPDVNIGGAPAHDNLFSFWSLENFHIFFPNNDRIECPPGFDSTASANLIFGPPTAPVPGISGATVKLIDLNTGELFSEGEAAPQPDGGFAWGLVEKSFFNVNPARAWAVLVSHDAGWYNPFGSSFQAYGSKDIGILPDP